jgi:MFS family permease
VAPILAQGAFARATATNFFFSLALNGFVLLPLHIQALGGTEVEIGVVMGLSSAVGIVSQPLIGPLVDALGRRPFMLAGVILALAAAVLAAAVPAIGGLAVARVLQGLGFSAFFVAALSYIVDIVPPARRGWALGIYGVSGFLPSAVAPLAGEWVIRHASFRALFVLSALLTLVPLALVWPMREARPPGEGRAGLFAGARGGLEDVRRKPMLLAVFFGLGSGTIFTFVPTFAEELGVRVLSLFYTAYAVAAVSVRLAGGHLIDTRGRRAVIVPSSFVQALAAAVLAGVGLLVTRTSRVPVLPALTVAGVLSGGAHGFLYPGLAALVTDATPPGRRAWTLGVFSAMFLAGQAAGSFVFGWVGHAAGYGPMWAVLASVLAAGGALATRLPEGRDEPR